MRKLILAATMLAIVAALPAACSKSPGGPSVSFSSPTAQTPTNGTAVTFASQPVTLTITNAVQTGSAPVTYTVEVATDAAFTNKVYTKAGISQGSNGTTTVTIPNLSGATTYFWHFMAVIDDVTGVPSPAKTFAVGPQVTIGVPVEVSPASGSAQQLSPTFIVNNVSRTGPAGTIVYDFQVSTSSSFSPIVAEAKVTEQNGQTTWTPSADLPAGALFWRVMATDTTNSVSGAFAAPNNFTAQPFDMTQATMEDNPADVPFWAVTTQITSVIFTDSAFDVDFTKRQGPDQWPESGFGDGGVQYTLGMCLNINNHWYCSGVVQFWDGRDLDASGVPSQVAQNWFYDSRWGPMQGHQPADGELVGIFVAQGNLRDSGNTSVKERSNVVIMPFGSTYFASGASTNNVRKSLPSLIKH